MMEENKSAYLVVKNRYRSRQSTLVHHCCRLNPWWWCKDNGLGSGKDGRKREREKEKRGKKEEKHNIYIVVLDHFLDIQKDVNRRKSKLIRV